MLNIAHRGFRSKYPENTMLAFQKALEAGADGIEFDVHLSKDGELVIIHDETLERTTDGEGLVKDKTLAELKKLNAAAKSNKPRDFEAIPTLKEYFAFAKKTKLITNIELKTGIFPYEGIEQKTYELIKEFDMCEKVILSSFNHETIMRVKEIDSKLVCGLLVDSWQIDPENYVQKLGIECWHPSAYSISKELVQRFHRKGIKVNTWFGSIQLDYKKIIETGVDAIITDYPDKIAGLIGRDKA
ncbi:glycerophosphodiester phosphodiesterase [Treponema phagedenis]|uniref:Glycerophosphodiester phosphodiesterase n=3 Tax=Treponema phagedenis TaxID=162 RepID=A0A0B7GUK9_TREPH|nr:glycerophosphodiester phosphodiesterase [Treponema phagedenis]NVP24416.1 glycerophosphodiester phosphodiesterase [Treponema phagedenis]NVP25344.1 glycerophosphodiester phosphodiesterase [Treponema phagedenis]QEJ97822.1 glycerophosphodiester phosphodiesterase [Treponema phagedenis]QEK01291.1 glycerophosphodiester phosphodiesterase [Treponema phagedenis]QEK03388.1 glycerophosphodiester phosphodiesterase [Treponema phagedenis]